MSDESHERDVRAHEASLELAQALKPRTTLWDLTSEIAELLELAATAETDEYRAAAEQALEAYREQLPQKVDDTRAYIKHQRMIAAAASQEANEQRDRAKAAANRAERAEQYVLDTMNAFGVKKLSGRTGEFRVQANPPAVEITREDLVTDWFWNTTVRLPTPLWDGIYRFMMEFDNLIEKLAPGLSQDWARWMAEPGNVSKVADKALIAAALKTPCSACGGHGEIEVAEDGSNQGVNGRGCRECNGTGKATVPGARLAQGKHLRIT